jgi:hypothetical protein
LRQKSGKAVSPTRSCGCLQKEKVTTHGCWGHPLYPKWKSIMERCNNENDSHYYTYGGRGITVCDRWHDVKLFIKDMFPSFKKGLTIERKDNNGNYEPNNCIWIPAGQQAKNKSNNINITYQGKTMCLAEWARYLHVSYGTLQDRLRHGWTPEKTVSTPIRKGKNKRKI